MAGNANLRPERSERFEVGIRQPFSLLNGSIGMTHFYTQVQNLIDFNTASFRLENLGRVESIGFEVDARAQPLESIEASAFASYANTEDQQEDRLQTRPTLHARLSSHWRPFTAVSAQVNVLYVGDIRDASVPTGDAKLGSDVRVDLIFAWSPHEGFEADVALDNATDAACEEAVGYRSVGIRPRAGVKLSF